MSLAGASHVGYVLRRFPRLSQSFVLNEIRALEASGLKIDVLALEPPRSAEVPLIETISDGDRTRSVKIIAPGHQGGPLFSVVLWAMFRHPVRLARTLILVARSGSQLPWSTFKAALLMARSVAAANLKHLHAHLHHGGEAVWLVHRLTGVRFSFTAHARDIYVRGENLRPRLADATFAVTVCEYNRSKLAQLYPPAADKIHIIHPFLSPRLLTERHASRAPDHGPLRLICVCRLIPKKGVAVLIDAVDELRRGDIAVQLDIVGDGRERDGLAAQIRRLDLGARVSLEGSCNASAVREYLVASHCFVLASIQAPDGDSDATPTVLGEAMAMGLPVISTRIAGIPEIVPEGAGLLVEPDDSAGLAAAIAELAACSPQQRQAMGERGRRFVRDHWNSEQDAQRLIGLFRRAIGDRNGPPYTDPPASTVVLTPYVQPDRHA